MDMQIDASKIRAGRERRAWSQEQLAEVSGLSLRTIQRVETGLHQLGGVPDVMKPSRRYEIIRQ